MSTTVDSRVVEMRFDNKHFESNVSTTMSTLDKLKAKLGFEGATKGLENVSSAAKNVNMNSLGGSVETVQAKFSALQVMAVTALANITNSAVNAGKRIVSALTIDPVKTGFQEYEMKMDSIKTIVNSTGRDLEDVNKLLNELNEYSDQTIYSFKDMTQNIGKFTNAGVGLEDAVLAIKGISNEAAVSGASAAEASRAMYNFSQALSSGYVKLIDWKSIENANMATKEFKQQLIDTAVELGVVTKQGDMYTTSSGKSFNATKNFNDVLQEQWMTTDVLIKTLGKYADENTDIGKKAFAAAQEVTKLTQMWDVLKETAQSGWARTWELIVGDLNTAKKIFTPLTNFFSDIINGMSDFRNRVLEIALAFSKPWDAISEKLGNVKKVVDNVKGAIGTLEDFQNIVTKVWRGDYNNWGDNPDRRDLLTAAGYDYRVVQDLVNKGYKYKLTIEDVEAAHKKYGLTMEATTGETKKVADAFGKLTDKQLKNLGLTEEEIKLYRALEIEADRAGISVGKLIEEMSETDGRDMLIDSFKNLGGVVVGVGKAIKEAWIDIFDPPSAEQLGIRLFGVIRSLKEFTKSLQITDETGKLNENGQKIKRTFEGIFASIDIVLTIVGGPLKIVFKLLTQLLGAFGFNILDVTAFIGDAIVAFRDWIDSVLDFSGAFEKIVDPIKNATKSFKEWIENLKKSENLPKDIAEGIASGFGKAFTAIKDFFKNIPKMFTDGFDSVGDSPLGGFLKGLKNGLGIAGQTIVELGKIILEKINNFLSARGLKTISTDAIAGLANGFKEGASKAWNAAVEMVKTLVDKVKDFLGIHSPSTVFMAIGGFIIAGLISGLKNAAPGSLGAFQDVLQPMIDFLNNIDFGAIFASIIGVGFAGSFYKVTSGFGNMLGGLGEVFAGTGEILQRSAKPIKKILKNTAKVVKSFSKVLNSIAFDIKVDAIKGLLESITKCFLLMVAAIIVMSYYSPGELWNGVGVIAAMAAILVLTSLAMSKISSASADIGKDGISVKGLSSGLAGIGAAILMLGLTAKMLGTMKPEQIKQGFLSLVGIVAAIGVFLIAFMKIPFGPSDAAIVQSLGKTMKQIATALLLMAVVVKILGGMSPGELIQGSIAIGAFGGMMIGLMAATKLISGSKNVAAIGGTLLKIALAIGVMALVAKTLGGMDPAELEQGEVAIIAFSGIIVGLMAATKLISGSKNIDKIGGTLLKIGIAIGVMGLVVKLLGGMSPGEILQGTLAITAFGGIIVGLMAATKLITGSKNIGKIGGAILAISGAIAIMALTAFMLSMISWEGFAKGTIMITVFGGMIVGLIAATKLVGNNADKISKTIMMVAGAIGLLALIAVLLGLVPVDKLIQGTIAVGVLSAMMAGLIAVTSLVKENAMKPLIILAAMMLILGGILITLSCLDPASVITAAISLSGLLVVMTGVLAALIPIGSMQKQAMKGAVALATMAVPLALFGLVLAMISALKVKDALPNVIALSVLCTTMTALLIPLALIGNFVKQAMVGMLALAAMAVPLAAFGLVLAMMSALNVANALPNVIALSTLCTVMTALLIPLTLIGALGYLPYLGVLALTAMAVPLVAFVGIIALMSGIENGIANALVLATLISVLGDVLVKISLVAPLAVIAVTALTALVSLMTVVGVLAAAIGALVTQFPQLQTFLDVGIPILVQMAGGLGQMIGAFITAIAGEVMTILPQLGLSLGLFMTNAMPFIMGAKMVDESVLLGVGILSGAILALVAADLIAGVTSFLQGGSSFADLGTQLSQFMLNAMPFIMGASMITPEMVSGVKALAETILIITAANLLEGITSFITGGSSLETFAAQLPILGQGLAAFSESLGGFTPDQLATVMCAAQAVKTLASAAAEIPNTGGLLASIVGENDLGAFAAQFPVLGAGLRLFLDSVGTFSEEQVATVDCAAKAIKSLAQASSEIPNSGGWLGQIVGENDLGTFAEQFPVLGTGLRGFLDNVGTFTDEQVATVDCAASAIKSLASAASEIPNSGGWVGAIVGENDLGTFADQFPSLGTGLAGFLTNVGTFTDEQRATVDCAANAVKTLASVASTIPNSGGWISKIVGDNDLGTFASNFPKLGEGLAGFVKKLGTFSEDKVTTVNTAVKAIKALGDLANANLSGAVTNISSFSNKLPSFGTKIGEFCKNMPSKDSVKSATDSLDKILSAVKKIANANSGPLATFANNLKKIGKDAVKKFVEAFTSDSAKTDLEKAAKKLGDKVEDGIKAKHKTIKTAGEDAAKKAVSGAKTQNDEAEKAGKDLGAGYVKGINAKKTAAYNAGYALGEQGAKGIKKGQKSNSPSKLAIQSGKWLGEGYVIGIGKLGNQVDKAGNSLGKTATDSLSSSISRISDMVGNDIDTQPTIRPVLDLSDVESGAATLGNMLNMDSSVGVRANLGAISSMMSLRGQNGGNSDVVSAIDKLSKKMDNMGNTTYHIDGVTYDDGSNVADAVGSLTRAIRLERRV